MKPKEWDEMSEFEKKKMGLSLASSMRGQYLISQALCVAREKLAETEAPYRETSNIQDMDMLIETVFPIYRVAKEAEKQFRERREATKAPEGNVEPKKAVIVVPGEPTPAVIEKAMAPRKPRKRSATKVA